MPSLTRPNRTGAMRLVIENAWAIHDKPNRLVERVLSEFPGFRHALRSAFRLSHRRGNKMLYLEGLGLFENREDVTEMLIAFASSANEAAFFRFFRDLQIMIDARNRALRKIRR